MGNGCCTKTKIADVPLAVVQTQNIAAQEIPYGYIIIYPGVLTPNETYTCPILSIHIYRESYEKTEVDYAATQFSNNKKLDRQLGSRATSKEEQSSLDETVVMVPVEDVLSINYTSNVTKRVKAEERSHPVTVVSGKGCCGGCCENAPVRQTQIFEERNAQRAITIHLQYSKYSNLNTISSVRILSESDRSQYFKNQFQSNTELKFYLVRNIEYDSSSFNQKKSQAEDLCRIVMQLKGMIDDVTCSSRSLLTKENVTASTAATTYPSPEQLRQILTQRRLTIFGTLHKERLHTIQTQDNVGTHVPVPKTTTVVAEIADRSSDAVAAEDD